MGTKSSRAQFSSTSALTLAGGIQRLNAAKSHRAAAIHHGKGDHAKAKEYSASAQQHSQNARQHSEQAHAKSQQQK
jgi:hypothetical protein